MERERKKKRSRSHIPQSTTVQAQVNRKGRRSNSTGTKHTHVISKDRDDGGREGNNSKHKNCTEPLTQKKNGTRKKRRRRHHNRARKRSRAKKRRDQVEKVKSGNVSDSEIEARKDGTSISNKTRQQNRHRRIKSSGDSHKRVEQQDKKTDKGEMMKAQKQHVNSSQTEQSEKNTHTNGKKLSTSLDPIPEEIESPGVRQRKSPVEKQASSQKDSKKKHSSRTWRAKKPAGKKVRRLASFFSLFSSSSSSKDHKGKNERERRNTISDKSTLGPVDLGRYNCAVELEELGLEALEFELSRLGLKSGGTLSQRAERLYAVKFLKNEEGKLPENLQAHTQPKYRKWFTHKQEHARDISEKRAQLKGMKEAKDKQRLLELTFNKSYALNYEKPRTLFDDPDNSVGRYRPLATASLGRAQSRKCGKASGHKKHRSDHQGLISYPQQVADPNGYVTF